MVNLCSKVRVDFGELIFSNHINYEISLRATEVIKSVFHSCLWENWKIIGIVFVLFSELDVNPMKDLNKKKFLKLLDVSGCIVKSKKKRNYLENNY